MNALKRFRNQLALLSMVFLILVGGIGYFGYQYMKPRELQCGTKTPVSFCGNASSKRSENAQMGKALFNSNCAACHHLYKNMTGPALAGIDSTLLWQWLTVKNKKIDTTKVSEMKMDYHRSIWNGRLTSIELNALYAFTKTKHK